MFAIPGISQQLSGYSNLLLTKTHPYSHTEIGNRPISCYFSGHWSRKLVATCQFFASGFRFRTKTALWPSKSWKRDFPAPQSIPHSSTQARKKSDYFRTITCLSTMSVKRTVLVCGGCGFIGSVELYHRSALRERCCMPTGSTTVRVDVSDG